MNTAEWNCTICEVTNRKLVLPTSNREGDRCVTCRTHHIIERDTRPVRWLAKAGKL